MRTVWVIDGAYLLKAAQRWGHFDYLKLKQLLEQENGEPFVESYYFNATPNPPTDQQNAFHTWLKSAPPRGPKIRVKLYQLKRVRVECPECHHQFEIQVQKGVDVGIASLIVKLAALDHFDRLVLSAGDGDFEDAISYVKEIKRKEFWLSGFEETISADLQSYADKVIWLDSVWEQIRREA